jgi:hypothetical protein
MANQYTGFAFIRGISAAGCTVDVGGVNGYASCFVDSVPLRLTGDLTEHQGADGMGVCALQWSNQRILLEATFRPASNTSVSAADAKAILIPLGAIVTLSGFKVVKMAGTATGRDLNILNGDWINMGDVTLTLNASGPGEVQLSLGYFFDHQDELSTPVLQT